MDSSSNPLPPLRRLIDHSLPVEDIVGSNLWTVDPDLDASEARDLLAGRRFDVAGVAAETIDSFVTIGSLAGAPGCKVQDVAKPIPASLCVEKVFPLGRLVEALRDEEYVFVLDGDQVRWLVTRSDLGAAAVSATVLAYLVVIEEGLRRLICQELGTAWFDLLPTERQSSISERFEDLVAENREIDLNLCANLADWLHLGAKTAAVRIRLGFPSRQSFKDATGSFVGLRNAVAHGRTVFDATGFTAAVDRVLRIRGFAETVWSLVDTLDPDFDLYVRTILLTEDGRQLAGPDAVDVDWVGPVHVITAWNPGGSRWSTTLNREANASLLEILTRRGLHASEVVGESPDGEWREESFLVTDAGRGYAVELASKFEQRAIFELDREELRVIRCDDGECVRSVKRRRHLDV